MNSRLVPRQVERAELLDLGRGSLNEVRRSLRDIDRINTWLGGTRLVVDGARALWRRESLTQAVILDIGTGSAHIPRYLLARAASDGVELRVMGADNNRRHLQIAQSEGAASPLLHLVRADGFRLPLADDAVDIVVSSLFLHHFRAPQIVALLREFERVSRSGFVMADIVRHHVPLAFFRLTRPVFARSYLTRYDGQASLRRAYTPAEMRDILAAAKLDHMIVREHFPFRMTITLEKKAP